MVGLSKKVLGFSVTAVAMLAGLSHPAVAESSSPKADATANAIFGPTVVREVPEPPINAAPRGIADAVSTTKAAAYRGTGGYIAGYQNSLTQNIALTAYDSTSVTITVDGYYIDFDAIGSSSLAIGTYAGATRFPFNGTNAPGLSMYGNGRGCNEVAGTFWVDDIAFTAGVITTFAARFVHRCEGFLPPEYGWVSFNSTVTYPWLGASNTVVYPDGITKTLQFTNTGYAPFVGTPAVITGAGFIVVADNCNGVVVNPGGSCGVRLSFRRPTTAYHFPGSVTVSGADGVAGGTATLDGLGVPGGEVIPITPFRLVDTRINLGASTFAPRSVKTVQVGGMGGIPTGLATGIIANVTGVNPTEDTWLRLWATGTAAPPTSNVNPIAGAVTPNLAFIPLSFDGKMNIESASGTQDVLVDVFAWVTADDSPSGARVIPMAPSRVYDSRWGDGPVVGSRVVNVRQGVIPANATAALLNVTIVEPTQPGFLTVWANGESRPVVSNLNFDPGQIHPNLVLARMDSAGNVSVFNSAGAVDVVIDVVGYLRTDLTDDTGRVLFPTPSRVFDTRPAALSGTNTLFEFTNGFSGVMNFTATNTFGDAFLTLWRTGTPRPLTSGLNWKSGKTRANVQVLESGFISSFVSAGQASLIGDLQVYFAPSLLS